MVIVVQSNTGTIYLFRLIDVWLFDVCVCVCDLHVSTLQSLLLFTAKHTIYSTPVDLHYLLCGVGLGMLLHSSVCVPFAHFHIYVLLLFLRGVRI